MSLDQQFLDALAATSRQADRCGFFLDFDGVLSLIQDDPESIQPVPGAVDALAALGGLVRTVAVVSGRPVSFLRDRLGGLPVRLHGLYGMESADQHGQDWTDPEVEPYLAVCAEVDRRARAELDPSVFVEFKRLSVGLHYRTAPQQEAKVREWGLAIAADYGLHALPGRMVLELAPPVHRDKGDVIRAVAKGLTCAWYVGDDLGDLPAMRALTELAAADPGFTAYTVAVANPETGDQVASAADMALASPHDVVRLLNAAVETLRATR